MKRLSALCWLVVLVGGVSCGSGSMSAPPVSLPAPISGRLDGPITVGDQGGDSRISISAPAGTVAPHATILIINTTAELSLNLQISPAVSAICAQPTRTCVTADDVGAFAAAISCRNGETLALVVIDPENGKEVGP
ncbi:MAG: hypothetical protein HYV03_02690, partial [Deltaproteobacteria bacterium]|nr:hypothetical protein [Deltaproteobacteria bacterium]